MRRILVLATTLVLTVGLMVPGGTAVGADLDHGDGATVTIVRDEYGVPHVKSDDFAALNYGVGYAQAQDRLWQAEVFRRLATGTQAELLGIGALPSDVGARLLFGPESRRTAMLASASVETQTNLAAFADGVNAWIEEAAATGLLPVEFGGVAPKPWQPEDTIAIFMAVLDNFGVGGAGELDNAANLQALIASLGPAAGLAVFADTHWLDDPSAPTSAPSDGAFGKVTGPKMTTGSDASALSLGGDETSMLDAYRAAKRAVGLSEAPSSNAIAIGSRLSADGNPLLLAGPQMGYQTPQINHEIGIEGAGLNVHGMELPGLPGVSIGVSRGIAWTLTTGGTDNADLYVETLNPANPGQYLFNGEWLDLDCRIEVFEVAGVGPVPQQLCASVHGPVVGTAPGVAITLKRASDGLEMQSLESFLDLQRVRSLPEFADALSAIAYNFNVLYADRRGNIAYFHVGRIPIRAAGDDPWMPHDGTGGAEWQGFIPWDEMPRSINPDQGWLTSWNNKPQANWPNSTGGFWAQGPVHRVNTLMNLLTGLERRSATPETVAEFNRIAGLTTDTPSGSASTVFVSTLLDDMVAQVDTGADARLPAVVGLLADWDWLQDDSNADGKYDSPAVTVFNRWWPELIARVFGDEFAVASLNANVAGNLVARLLDPAPAVPPLHDYLDGETIGNALTASLIDTLDGLTADFGSADPATWLQDIAVIRWSPIGAGSVPDTLWMNRGTYNQITHMRGNGRAMNVISPGQSGDLFSPHFADQLELYATWTYKTMHLTHGAARSNAESVTVLHP